MAYIEVMVGGDTVVVCESVILVPEKALVEAGYIQMFSEETDGASKHKFHAMAQMAYFQYQDDEFEVEAIAQGAKITAGEREEVLESGLVLCRKPDGELKAYVAGVLNVKKLLEAANRFCTRWVRLDI